MTPAWLLAWQLAQPVDPADLVPLYEQAVARTAGRHGPQSPETARSLRDLALFHFRNRRWQDSESLLRRAMATAEEPEDIEHLAEIAAATGRPAEAEALLRKAAESPAAAVRARAFAKLAAAAEASDRVAALKLYRRALEDQEKATGPASAPVAVRWNDVGLLLKQLGQPIEAGTAFRRALAIQEKALGPRHPELATTLNNLSTLQFERNQLADAEASGRRALHILEETLSPRSVRTALCTSNLADVLRARGNEAAAKPLYRQAFSVFRESLGEDHPWTREAKEAAGRF